MARGPNAIRRGQYCAVGERRLPTMMDDATGSSWTYTIGRVRKASAAGDEIREATVYRNGAELRMREDEQGRWWQSYTIRPEQQERAGELLGQEWSSLDLMREAFR